MKQEDHSGTGPMGLVEDGPCPHSILGGPTRLCPQLCPSPAPGLAIQEETGLLDNQLLPTFGTLERRRLKPSPCCVALAQMT